MLNTVGGPGRGRLRGRRNKKRRRGRAGGGGGSQGADFRPPDRQRAVRAESENKQIPIHDVVVDGALGEQVEAGKYDDDECE